MQERSAAYQRLVPRVPQHRRNVLLGVEEALAITLCERLPAGVEMLSRSGAALGVVTPPEAKGQANRDSHDSRSDCAGDHDREGQPAPVGKGSGAVRCNSSSNGGTRSPLPLRSDLRDVAQA